MSCRSWLPSIPYRNLGLKMGYTPYTLEMTIIWGSYGIMIVIHWNMFFPLNFQTHPYRFIALHFAICYLVMRKISVSTDLTVKTASKMRSAAGLSLLDVSATPSALSFQCWRHFRHMLGVSRFKTLELETLKKAICFVSTVFISFHFVSLHFVSFQCLDALETKHLWFPAGKLVSFSEFQACWRPMRKRISSFSNKFCSCKRRHPASTGSIEMVRSCAPNQRPKRSGRWMKSEPRVRTSAGSSYQWKSLLSWVRGV